MFCRNLSVSTNFHWNTGSQSSTLPASQQSGSPENPGSSWSSQSFLFPATQLGVWLPSSQIPHSCHSFGELRGRTQQGALELGLPNSILFQNFQNETFQWFQFFPPDFPFHAKLRNLYFFSWNRVNFFQNFEVSCGTEMLTFDQLC